MSYSKDFIKKVVEATNLVDLISENGIALIKSGSNYKGLCPFHSEKTPSFNVNPLRGFFHCFGCKISGDGIRFLMEHNRFSFAEAVKELANRANIPLEKEYLISSNRILEKDEGFECLDEAALFFKKNLSTEYGKDTLKYLRKRNISERMFQKFNLGTSPEDWQSLFNHLKIKKKNVKDLLSAGLIKYSKKSGRYYDTFRSRLMFPIKDIQGKCIGFGGRALKSQDKPKYINSPETKYYQKNQVLYGFYEGLDFIRKSRTIIIVEGYIDVIRLHENGFTQAVAPCGTALTYNHLKIIKRYVDEVILIFDGDLAGISAALKSTHLLLPYPIESYIVRLPDGEDPDTFLLSNGGDAFKKLLGSKITALDYFLQETLKKFPESLQGRIQSLDELLPVILKISDLKRRQIALIAISERMKISPEIIANELKRNSNKNLSKTNFDDKIKRSPDNSKNSQDELWLLQSLLRKGELWPLVRNHLGSDEFQNPLYRRLYAKLLEFPDSEFQPFDPLRFEKSNPRFFQAVMFILKEEIVSHDFGLSLVRVKERNLDLSFHELILKSKTIEEKAKIGSNRRKEEKKIREILKIFENISTI